MLTPQVLMERLCALVPRPRKHLVTYHGVLAPAAGLRPRVVPRVEAGEGQAAGCRHGGVDVLRAAKQWIRSSSQQNAMRRCGR